MLVIHWSKHNKTGSILKSGIRPSTHKYNVRGGPLLRPPPHGVYVYPFSDNKTIRGTWRMMLKGCPLDRGNYNGFVFRLIYDDFPIIAGIWNYIHNNLHNNPNDYWVHSFKELKTWIEQLKAIGFERCLEIIIPRRIAPNRILRVYRDRTPKAFKDTKK